MHISRGLKEDPNRKKKRQISISEGEVYVFAVLLVVLRCTAVDAVSRLYCTVGVLCCQSYVSKVKNKLVSLANTRKTEKHYQGTVVQFYHRALLYCSTDCSISAVELYTTVVRCRGVLL